MPKLHPKIEQLLELKKVDLEKKKKRSSAKSLLDKISVMKKPVSFSASIKKPDKITLICEYKRSSPSEGQIGTAGLEDIVLQYEKGGASAISVLTERDYFSGSIDDLKKASEITVLPLLRKDFVIDEYEIIEARAYGASAVLLIVGITPNLEKMVGLSNELRIEPLVECFTKEDIEQAISAGANIIGVNNRSFIDLSVDKNRALELKQFIPANCISVAESGVRSSEEVQLYKKAGFDSILIGTSLMKSSALEKLLTQLVKAGNYNGI